MDSRPQAQERLAADCSRCAGLCCVALAFARSGGFAFDKPAGEPCGNLDRDFRCRIHPHLRDRGFAGCTVFDCFGAGQHVTQHTFGGRTWREAPGIGEEMFAVFPIVRQLHELLWYLEEALRLPAAAPLREELESSRAAVRSAADETAPAILRLDLEELRAPAAALLREAARLTREAAVASTLGRPEALGRPSPLHRPNADLAGADLRHEDLRTAELRGALLIAADLRGADLTAAELLGADLRDARLDGADLREAVFLTQMQVNAAQGDARTRLPDRLERPSHWASR